MENKPFIEAPFHNRQRRVLDFSTLSFFQVACRIKDLQTEQEALSNSLLQVALADFQALFFDFQVCNDSFIILASERALN
jgi:hypothetical protein